MNRAIRIEAVAREQMERYEKYIQKLQAKVEKQREDRKISDEEFLRRIKAQEEERFKQSIRKRPKQGLVNDLPYVKKLPKSKMRKVVRLSDDLQRKGVLKTQEDVDKFWKDFGNSGTDQDSQDKTQEDWETLNRKTNFKIKSNRHLSSESPDKFSEASIPPRGHTKHLADEILSARENLGSSEEIHSESEASPGGTRNPFRLSTKSATSRTRTGRKPSPGQTEIRARSGEQTTRSQRVRFSLFDLTWKTSNKKQKQK